MNHRPKRPDQLVPDYDKATGVLLGFFVHNFTGVIGASGGVRTKWYRDSAYITLATLAKMNRITNESGKE